MIDHLLKDLNGKDNELNLNATEFASSLGTVAPIIKDTVTTYAENVSLLKLLTSQIQTYTSPIKQQVYSERIRNGLTSDKKKLEEALKAKDLRTVLTITKKIESEDRIIGGTDKDKKIVAQIKQSLRKLEDIKIYKELIDSAEMLSLKCQNMSISQNVFNWKCDKTYLTSKMTLSEDGLTYGNQAGNGYPAIIGDTPIETGILAYEVIPEALCCSGKEGFGIIELERYKEKFASDSVTPTAYDEMHGFFYGDVAKNMSEVSGSEFKNGTTYRVVTNLLTCTMSITGPGCKLKTHLKPDTFYVPCFSCGCRNNKIIIKPIEAAFDD